MLDRKLTRATLTLLLVGAVGLTGCESEGGQAEIGEVPEMAEVDTDEVMTEVAFEEALPLTAEDEGDILLVTGTVTGTVIPEGFFVATEHGETIFVQADEAPVPGQLVSVTGPLQSVEVPVFDEWETEALGGELEAEFELVRTWYLEGSSVAVM